MVVTSGIQVERKETMVLTNLMKLNLSDNYITTLPFTAFRSLTRLSTLDISNNTIVDIGEAFVDMPEIKVGLN